MPCKKKSCQHFYCYLLGVPKHVCTYCMHPEHKASVDYKQLSSAWLMLRAADLLHSMDMTQIYKIARSPSCGHSLISPSFCVCLLQLNRWLFSDYTISRFLTSNSGHDFAMYTFRHIGTSAPSGPAYVALWSSWYRRIWACQSHSVSNHLCLLSHYDRADVFIPQGKMHQRYQH